MNTESRATLSCRCPDYFTPDCPEANADASNGTKGVWWQACPVHRGTKHSIKASAPLAVGLIAAYADGVGVNLAIQLRAVVSLSACTECKSSQFDLQAVESVLTHLPRPACNLSSNLLVCSSYIPMPCGVGLKTSSASVAAITVATARAAGQVLDAKTTVKIAVAVQKSLGLTSAGSVDDTWSAIAGGLVVASARSLQLVARFEPPSVKVVVLVPHYSKPWAHSVDRVALLRPQASKVSRIRARLLDGDIWGASTEHAVLHAATLQYSTRPLRVALDAGALGVCLSGKGPAIAAFATSQGEQNIVRAWAAEFPNAILCRTEPTTHGLLTESPMLQSGKE